MIALESGILHRQNFLTRIASTYKKYVAIATIFFLKKQANFLWSKMEVRAVKDLVISKGLLTFIQEGTFDSKTKELSESITRSLEFFYEIQEQCQDLISRAKHAEMQVDTLSRVDDILSRIISNYHQSLRIVSLSNKKEYDSSEDGLSDSVSNRGRSVIKELYGHKTEGCL